MIQDLPNIDYERNMNHNYIVLSKCDFFGKEKDKGTDFRTRMLLENHIPGLLPVTHRLVNGESRYYYEINSLQSLDRLYEKNEIKYDALKSLLSGCVSLFERLEEYLLDGAQIIIKPELVYINVEKMEPYFVCYPDYEGDVRLAFMEFIDGLLTKIDHTDERAVVLGYQVYRYTRNPNYVISEIGTMLEHAIVHMAESNDLSGVKEAKYIYKQPECDIENYQERENNKWVVNKALNRKKESIEAQPVYGSNFMEYRTEFENEEEEITEHESKSKHVIIDLIGGIFCVFVALCAVLIVVGAKQFRLYQLGSRELYLYGAVAMAGMAAVLFFSSYCKKKKYSRAVENLRDDDLEEENLENTDPYASPTYAYTPANNWDNTGRRNADQGNTGIYTTDAGSIDRMAQNKACSETVCLGENMVEERMLCGRINGREVNISLNHLPMTVGKLANVSDFVIDDAAVSKMHARFEERDGKVYVCDLNSTNGTVRNGVLLDINQPVALEPGDRIRFGRTSFTYC